LCVLGFKHYPVVIANVIVQFRDFEGHPVRTMQGAEPTEAGGAKQQTATLFLRNLPIDTNQTVVKHWFSGTGVTNVRVSVKPGGTTAFAHLEFVRIACYLLSCEETTLSYNPSHFTSSGSLFALHEFVCFGCTDKSFL